MNQYYGYGSLFQKLGVLQFASFEILYLFQLIARSGLMGVVKKLFIGVLFLILGMCIGVISEPLLDIHSSSIK
ncbi:MAG: hypothetical protein SFU91_14630 [Chloroherpetonaceae bacterium]|nr:hypothetical protein [Chloroherpetonaceae bacterium]